MSPKPKLFVGLDGPILVPAREDSQRDEVLKAAIAPFAPHFLRWAVQHYDVHWLTDRPFDHARYVTERIGLQPGDIKYAGFSMSRVPVLERVRHQGFKWVDSELTPDEVAWLAQHGLHQHLVQPHPHDGVAATHITALRAVKPGR